MKSASPAHSVCSVCLTNNLKTFATLKTIQLLYGWFFIVITNKIFHFIKISYFILKQIK